MLLGFTADEDFHPEFWDKAENLSGVYIIQREAKRAMDGLPFFVNDADTMEAIDIEPIDMSSFLYYYKIWENYSYFGLPHGKGWLYEREWLLEFLKVFDKAKQQIEIMVEQRESKKADSGG